MGTRDPHFDGGPQNFMTPERKACMGSRLGSGTRLWVVIDHKSQGTMHYLLHIFNSLVWGSHTLTPISVWIELVGAGGTCTCFAIASNWHQSCSISDCPQNHKDYAANIKEVKWNTVSLAITTVFAGRFSVSLKRSAGSQLYLHEPHSTILQIHVDSRKSKTNMYAFMYLFYCFRKLETTVCQDGLPGYDL